MKLPPFVQAAADPTLIPGIYDACDQWCMYCSATHWCLAYRCGSEIRSGQADVHRSLADRLYEGIRFLKQVSEAEGRPTPEIDAMLSDDPRTRAQFVIIDDPIERIGRRYGRLSDAYLLSHPDFPFEMKHRASGPTPFEVFAWYHQLVPGKVYRALVSAAHAARGDAGRHDDALISAKVALLGIDRSLDALAAMTVEDDDSRLRSLQAQLRRLRRELEARFPSARAFVRAGLDASR
jgi:hypothetical protein